MTITEMIKIIIENGLTVGIVIYLMFINYTFNNKTLEKLVELTELQERISDSQERLENKIDAEL